MYLYCSYLSLKIRCLIYFQIFLLINMSYLHQKLCLQTPKSYQELTRNRPTKKRNYKYTINTQEFQEIVSIPLTNIQQVTSKNYLHSDEIIQSQLDNRLKEKRYDKQVFSKKTQRKLNNYEVEQISKSRGSQKFQSQKPKYAGKSAEKKIKIEDDSLIQQDFRVKLPLFDSIKVKQNFTYQNYKGHASDLSDKHDTEESPNKTVQKKQIEAFVTQEIANNKQNKQTKTDLHISKSKTGFEKEKKQGLYPLIQKAFKKVQYYYGQKQIDKDKISQEVQKNYEQTIKKQKIFSKQCQLDIQIEEVKKKILNNSPLTMPVGITNLQIMELMESSFNQQICKMSDFLSKLIEMDINLLKLRQAFESQKSEEKWQNLKKQLQTKNIYFQINKLKEQISVSFYQKNPFGFKTLDQQNEIAKQLATLYAECQRIWVQQIEKCAQLEKIRRGGNQTSLQDLQNKCNLNLQDIVCFINVNSQKLYRSRDIFSLFRRFLKLQGKNVEKKVGLSTIKFQTFINKLAK